jgi:hypothetical protein
MSPVHDIQSSFAGGEFTPDVQGRVDIAKYKTGLARCRNFIPGPLGEVASRLGTMFLGFAKFSGKKSILKSFVSSDDNSYAIEFGDKYARFWKDDSLIYEDEYYSTLPAWDTQITYATNDYVLASGSDGGGSYSIHVFKSLLPNNIGHAPLSYPTYWQDLGHIGVWSGGTTYATGAVVSEVRGDGVVKSFVSLQNSNTNHDPLGSSPWNEILPNYDVAHTYALNDYIVIDVGGDHYRYKSLQNSNTGNDPQTEPTWWLLNQPAAWDITTTYASGDWVNSDLIWLGAYSAWSTTPIYGIGDYVTAVTGGHAHRYRSLIANNQHNDPLNPLTWWNYTNTGWWANGTTYAIDVYVIVGVFNGYGSLDWYRYKSLQNSNTNHDPTSSPTWWVLDQPATWSGSTTYALNDEAQKYISNGHGGFHWVIYKSGQNSNTNHDPESSGPAWVDDTPTGPFRVFESTIGSNLANDPTNPSASDYWAELISPIIYEVETDYLEADLPSLKFVQSADTLYIVHPNYPPQELKHITDAEWTISDYEYEDGPFMFPNTDVGITMGTDDNGGGTRLTVNGTTAYFVAEHVGALFKLRFALNSQAIPVSIATTSGTGGTVRCGGGWKLITSGTWMGTLVLERSDDGTNWQTIKSWTSNSDTNINTYGNEVPGYDADPFADSFLIRLNWSAMSVHTGFTANLTRDNFTHIGIVEIVSVTDARHAVVTVVRDTLYTHDNSTAAYWYPAGNMVSDWAEGSWSNYRGWPSAVAFSQDRLCFASTPAEPNTTWMTRTGNYNNFGTSIPLVDDDGISMRTQARNLNPIKSILAFLNSLLEFASDSEWNITSDNGMLTPSTVYSKLQGARGIGDVDPVMIGNRIIFASPRGSCVRDMEYQPVAETFLSENVSFMSKHLFAGHSIVSAAYQQEPDSLLWLVRDDGIMLCLTYMREQEVLSWSWHDTVGTFESVCSIPGDTRDELWMVVLRNGRRCIEKMAEKSSSILPEDQFYVDGGISGTIPHGIVVFGGLSHLEGLTVAINHGGFTYTGTVSSATVSLNPDLFPHGTITKVVVGLPFVPEIETLDEEFPMRDGTLQGRKYQMNRVSIKFVNSRGGLIGMDSVALKDKIDFRNPPAYEGVALDDASDPTPLFTGFLPLTLPQNFNAHGHIFYRQDEPMPVTITGIYPIVEPGTSV